MTSLCVVSYLNSKPFTDGLEHFFSPEELAIRLLIPSLCAQDFQFGASQVGLLPAAALLDFEAITLLGDYCIGADGFVDSVLVVAHQPIETIKALYLDWHSLTSNGLARLLFRNYWQQPVELRSEPAYFDLIRGEAAGVIIGDRALAERHRYPYVYDLAEAWHAYTGLPFAFAVWCYAPGAVTQARLQRIAQAFRWGMQHRQAIAARWASHFGMSTETAYHYLTQRIDYAFDDRKQDSLRRYLQELALLDGRPMPQLNIAAPTANLH